MVWIPSHKSWDEARALGYSREDWFGNREADHWAGDMAQAMAAPAALSRFQDRRLELARAAVGVIGATHQAALEHDSVPGGFFDRMRRTPRRLPTEKGPAGPGKRWLKPAQVGVGEPEGPAPDGVHQLAADDGDARPAFVPPRGCKRVGSHKVSWRASCTKCGAAADRTAKWLGLGRTICPAGDPATGLGSWLKLGQPRLPCPGSRTGGWSSRVRRWGSSGPPTRRPWSTILCLVASSTV